MIEVNRLDVAVQIVKESINGLNQYLEGLSFADIIVTGIKERTARGIDMDGKPFEPYSPSYSKLTGKSLVNLKQTGKMLDSLTAVKRENKLVFSCPGATNAQGKNYSEFIQEGTEKMPARPFMGMNPEDMRKIKDLVEASIRSYYSG